MNLIRAAIMVVGAMTVIVLGDAAGKVLTTQGFSPFFIAWSRFGLAAALMLPFSGMQRHEWRLLLNWRVMLRAFLIIGTIATVLTALKTEPIANVFGGFFVGPIVAYFLSAGLLKERITWVRTLMLLIGFAGVLLVVKPGFGVSTGMMLAVIAGCFHGGYVVATRWLAGSYRPRFLLISQLLIGAIVLMPFGLSASIPEVGAFSGGLILVSAAGSAIGNYLLVTVNRTTPASIVAPLIYSQLIAATVVGLVIFNELPDAYALFGILIIIISGLFALWTARRD